MTIFSYDNVSVEMDVDPLHPRSHAYETKASSGYDSGGTLLAYDHSAPILTTETLVFPAISTTTLNTLNALIQNLALFTDAKLAWSDRGTVKQARFISMVWHQVAPSLHEVSLTLET